MKPAELRKWIRKYGNLGVLMVGAYLALHHVWHRRRNAVQFACAGLFLLSGWLLLHPKPHRNPAQIQMQIALLPLPSKQPEFPVPAESLQDDTELGPPLPDADEDNAPAINGDLFFAARFHKWSGEFYQIPYGGEKKEETLSEAGPSYLYRMHPDGSHRVQLTAGKASDYTPTLSPDGKWLGFVRDPYASNTTVCLMNARGGRVTTLCHLPDESYDIHLTWSPDGRYLAFLVGYEQGLYVLNMARRTVRHFPEAREFAWSPDGRLYERDSANHARIVNLKTGASTSITDVIHNPLWLDNHTLVGDMPSEGWRYEGALRFISDEGREIRRLDLQLIGDENDYETFYDQHGWHRLPRHNTTLILETWRDMSDGPHYGCYRVDTETGKCRLIQNGELIGLAPDGNQVAIADHKWVGPYKRGGARVGPLQIVSLKTGRTRLVSDPLSCIEGGSWQAAPARQHLAPQQALMQAIEEGDIEQAGKLLSQGASANAHYAEGATALMLGAADGRADIVSLLLRHHANVNAADKNGNPPLLWAVGANKAVEEVSSMLQQETVRRLLEAGGKANQRNIEGHTALMVAAQQGRATLIPVLLNHHADVDARSEGGWTALMFAASECNPNTARMLLKSANPSLKNKEGATAYKLIGEDGQTDRGMEHTKETHAAFDRAGVRQ